MDGPASAPPALITTLIGAAAGIALAFSTLIYVKQLGLGVAIGLTADLVLVRVLVAPSLLRLAGARQ